MVSDIVKVIIKTVFWNVRKKIDEYIWENRYSTIVWNQVIEENLMPTSILIGSISVLKSLKRGLT